MNTKQRGDVAEQAAVLAALRRGWGVLRPVGDTLPYDLVFGEGSLDPAGEAGSDQGPAEGIRLAEQGVAACGEFPLTGPATQILNGLVPTMLAMADQDMDGHVGDLEEPHRDEDRRSRGCRGSSCDRGALALGMGDHAFRDG